MSNEIGESSTAAPTVPVEVLAIVESLETMAFVTCDPAERADVLNAPAEPQWTAIAYAMQDGRGGLIEVATSMAFGQVLAANMLALAPDDPECRARAEDVLRELLNVACGTLLRHALPPAAAGSTGGAGPRRTVFVGLPGGKPLTEAAWQQIAEDPKTSALFAEGQPLLVRFNDRIDGSTELPE